jgi:uncharacterized protein HemX
MLPQISASLMSSAHNVLVQNITTRPPMIRKLDLLYLAALLCVSLSVTGCGRNSSLDLEAAAQQKEEQRLQDQKERAALVERMKAAALAQEKKQEPIKALQKQIDELDAQITDARSKGKDWRALEKKQEALEAQKYELQH